MALVKYGGGVVQVSGSIAGTTHARNRFGNYIRARTKPVNPRSSRQTTVRARVQFLSEAWKDTVTASQRGAWNSYAAAINWLNKLGETVQLTGFNHFMRSNLARFNFVQTIVADGPTELSLPAGDPAFAVVLSEATGITVTFDDTMDWIDEDDALMLLSIGTPQNATRNFFNGPWRYHGALEGDGTTPITTPDGPEAVTAYTLTEGQRIWVKASIYRADGRISTPFTADSVLVGA